MKKFTLQLVAIKCLLFLFLFRLSVRASNCSKDYWKLLPLLLSIIWSSLVTSWVVFQKIYSKIYIVSCTNTHCDVIESVNHGMVKTAKTWISWEQNIIFLQKKKILSLCLRWWILRSEHFVVEVTFKASVCYSLSNFYFSLNDRPSKTMTNVFYFM